MLDSVPSPLVATDWLAVRLEEPDLVVLDASWYLAAAGRDGRAEYGAAHLPGALFWDLEALSDRRSRLPHMLPDPDTLAGDVGSLGIGNQHAIVVYDGSGSNLSAARAWWTFRVYGHDRVAVLDGGLTKWRAEGRPLQSGEVRRPPGSFIPRFRPELVSSYDQVRALLGSPTGQLLDARVPGRFEGRDPEPRPGLRSGHIPGSKNLPFTELVASDGTLLAPDQLAQRFRQAGIDLSRRVVASCGSGVTACCLALGLEVMGSRDYAVYDGSWTEWGGREDAPVETGPSGPSPPG